MLEFRILGPLEVRSDGVPVDLGGPRQRALLAVLLVRPNESVGADALIQALWGEEAPPTAAKALQVAVSRLRRGLGPAADRLETVGGGYRLRVEPGELEDPRDLSLWRGPALADLRYEPALQSEIRRLDELRAAAIEDRVQAALDQGDHGRLAGELGALAAEYPLRERLRGQQMLALYRAGRHADALAAFQDARAALDELGLEPGPELRDLEQAILTHDPALAAPTREDVTAAPPTRTFGRDDDVRAVLALLDQARLVTLTGPGGVGKTRLATEVARAGGGRFASLASTADAERIPAVLCDALGAARVPGESDTDALDRVIGAGPLLLVADNLEHLPGAAPLLAGLLERHAGLTVLATSREPLHIRAERRYPVAPLARDEGVALFADRARAHDPSFAPDLPAMAAICELVGDLPLAIELAAARLGVLTPAALATRLGDALSMLDRGPRDAPERQQTLRATLDWSFDLLDRDEQDAFTALGAFAGGCDLDAAEAVTGAPLEVLEQLVAKSLVIVTTDRLALLEPVRQYAAERLAARSDAHAVRLRHLDHYVALAERTETAIWALERGCPEFATLQRDHDNLRAAVSAGLRAGEARRVLRLVSALSSYMWFAEASDELRRWWEPAYAAAGAELPVRDRARARFAQSKTTHSVTERLGHVRAAVALFREVTDDDVMLVRSLADLALLLTIENDRAGGRGAAQEALAIARRLGDDALIGASLAELAQATADPDEALALAHEAAAHLRAAGALVRVAQLFSYLGFAALAVDAYERSEALAHEALGVAGTLDDPYTTAFVHGNWAVAALLGGAHDNARAGFLEELATGHRHGLPMFYFEALLGLAGLAAAGGDDQRAAVLDAAAWALSDRPVAPAESYIYGQVQRLIDPARARLGEAGWDAAAACGRAMTADEAVAYALDTAPLPR